MTLEELLENDMNQTIFNADASRDRLSTGYIMRSLWSVEKGELD